VLPFVRTSRMFASAISDASTIPVVGREYLYERAPLDRKSLLKLFGK